MLDRFTALSAELEALAAAGAVDEVALADVADACRRANAMTAAVFLRFCLRAGEACAGHVWTALTSEERRDLAAAMFVVHPAGAIVGLGVERIHGVLQGSRDAALHERVARALGANSVPGAHSLLSVLMPPAQALAASVLGEREAAQRDSPPPWAWTLPEPACRRAVVGFALGCVAAHRETPFASLVATFQAADWRALANAVRLGTERLDWRAFELLEPYRDRLGLKARAAPRPRTRGGDGYSDAGAPVARGSDAERAVAIIAAVEDAGPEELAAFAGQAQSLLRPGWRTETLRAVLRRAVVLSVRVDGLACNLPRRAIVEEIVAGRLECGDMAVLGQPAWKRIDRHRRFTLLDQVLALMQRRVVEADAEHLALVVRAIATMPPPLGGILATKLVDGLALCPKLTPALLDAIAITGGRVRSDVLTAAGRACALRGDGVTADKFMGLARAELEGNFDADVKRRLNDVLDLQAEIPVELVSAITSLLATASDLELPGLLRTCARRLPQAAREVVLAGMLARGRAVPALASGV